MPVFSHFAARDTSPGSNAEYNAVRTPSLPGNPESHRPARASWTSPLGLVRGQSEDGRAAYSPPRVANDIAFAITMPAEDPLNRTRGLSQNYVDARDVRGDSCRNPGFGIGTKTDDVRFLLHVPDMMRLPTVETEGISIRELLTKQWNGIVLDHTEFYSTESLTWLATGFAAGALMANTGFDDHFVRHKYLENVVHISEDDFYEAIHQPHFLGDGSYTIPVFAIAALSGPLVDKLPCGPFACEWGQRSLRTVLVGGPPMLAAQVLTGASRPSETFHSSKWKPLQDNNGVSGHSFMGAIPFMSAANITDSRWLKASLYALSAAPAISRINDDKHYFSQAFLGWWMAYVAATAVDRSHNSVANVRWFATPVGDGVGLGMTYRH